MNTILTVLGIILTGILIDVGISIYKEVNKQGYHERVDKINQLHEDNLSNTRGARDE